MDKKDCYLKLERMLNNEIRHTEILLSLLKKESGVLPRDADALLNISSEKNLVLKELEQCHANRNALTQASGFSPDHQGFKSFLAGCDQNGKLLTTWTSFMKLVKECRNMNQLNGSIMNSSLRVVKQALSILYGQQVNENTYDASGNAQSSCIGRSIAKA